MRVLAANHMMTDAGRAYLEQLEGLQLEPYPDADGYSIGYGHFIEPGEEWMMNGITQDEADILLDQDLANVEQAIDDTITQDGSPEFFDGLMMFVFNIGYTNFASSQLAALVNDPSATDAQIRALWANAWVGNPPKPELLARRQKEIDFAYNTTGNNTIVTYAKSNYWWLLLVAAGVYTVSKS